VLTIVPGLRRPVVFFLTELERSGDPKGEVFETGALSRFGVARALQAQQAANFRFQWSERRQGPDFRREEQVEFL
jgi:hypothetical protein